MANIPNDADYDAREYQDDLDTDPYMTDSVTQDETDDMVETLGVPADELSDELDKRDLDDPDTTDDMREEIQDLDEGQGERD